MIQKGIVEITVDCNLNEIEKVGPEYFRVKWIGGEEKIISASTFKFATETMAQALNDVAVICALNKNVVRSINLKMT